LKIYLKRDLGGNQTSEQQTKSPGQEKEDMKMQELRCVGHSVIRSDAEAKVRGTALYTEDMLRPDMLVAKALWPKYPHALIKSIDTSKAAALEGV